MRDMDKDGGGPSFFPLGYHATICMGYGDHKGVTKLPKKPFLMVSGYFEFSWIVEL